MFWNYIEWTNAFWIQIVAIAVAYIVGVKSKIKKPDLFLAIALVSPVALFTISAGVSGAIFMSDFAAIYLLIRKENQIKKFTIIVLAFFMFLLWPVLSTIGSVIYQPFSNPINQLDTKILTIQFLRYFLYFVLFSKLVSKPYNDSEYIFKLLKVQSIMLFFIFTAILLGYFTIIDVDVWNALIGEDLYGETLGGGGMFLYRGGIGTLATIAMPLLYYCYIKENGFYKYLLGTSIYIILFTVLFSGSRQGIFFSIVSLILAILFLKQYKKGFQFLFVGLFIGFLALQNEEVKNTSEWVLNRYDIILDDKADLSSEVGERNFALEEAKKQHKGLFQELNGIGLGGVIIPTESDYYNTYSYFGIIGSILYYIFIFYTIIQIWKSWINEKNIFLKDIKTIALIGSFVIPLYGFQQWYIMTYGSNNAMNIYLTLFIYSLALRDNSYLNKKR